MPAYETIDLEVRDGVAHLTLNRPDAANGINLQLAQDLMRRDARDRVPIPTPGWSCSPGPGARFCGGGDLKGFAGRDDLPTHLREILGPLHVAIAQLVRGDGAGGGRGAGQRRRRGHRAWWAPPTSCWRGSRRSS